MQLRHAAQFAQDRTANPQTGVDTGRHGEVQQNTGKHVVTAIEGQPAGTTDQIRPVLTIGQPTGGFTGGAALGKGEDRGTFGLWCTEGVGMDRDEQVSVVFPGQNRAIAKANVVVPGSGQLGGITRPIIDEVGQGFRHFQNHIFLAS